MFYTTLPTLALYCTVDVNISEADSFDEKGLERHFLTTSGVGRMGNRKEVSTHIMDSLINISYL